MGHVTILVNPTRRDATRLADQTAKWLDEEGHGATVVHLPSPVPSADPSRARDLDRPRLAPVSLRGSDLALSMGGDGTFLRLVPLAYVAQVPVLGVNFGRLGYLLQVAPDGLRDELTSMLGGVLPIEHRVVLSVRVNGELSLEPGEDRSIRDETATRDGGSPWWVALNEMVAEKTVPGHMVRFDTSVDTEALLSYRADGMLVATPTGSTAYNLSAGGPVLAPGLEAMVMTPIAPHLSIDRSVVLRSDQVATVRILPERPAVLVVDGRAVGRLSPGSEVVCGVAPERLSVVCTKTSGFAGSLRRAFTGSGC